MRYILIAILILTLPSLAFSSDIKNADLAGSWYPSDPAALSNQIKAYLNKANLPQTRGDLIAIISPHAGINYSGAVAAYGFKLAQKKQIDTVIVVGFSHRLDFDGIAVFDKDGLKTPLGILSTDRELTLKLKQSNKKIFSKPEAFAGENSIELILPFIQVALSNVKIVLLAIGRQSLENSEILGASLSQILAERNNFLMVASSDMSHYLEDSQAKKADANTINLVKEMQPEELYLNCFGNNRLCGTGAVTSVMIAAKNLGANTAYILKQANSGIVTRDFNNVVGYFSAALVREKTEKNKMDNLLNEEQKKKLLKLARDTITLFLASGKTLEPKEDDPALKQVMGAFVTLHKNGELRGCIGNIVGQKPLYLTVRDMAIASATEDPRFDSVTKEELPKIHIEISALSPLKKINNPDEIVLGKHGVVVRDFYRSGVYLPQVATETGWTKEQFMDSLCGSKAGMRPDAWRTGKCDIYIFSAEVFGE